MTFLSREGNRTPQSVEPAPHAPTDSHAQIHNVPSSMSYPTTKSSNPPVSPTATANFLPTLLPRYIFTPHFRKLQIFPKSNSRSQRKSPSRNITDGRWSRQSKPCQ
ncbi:hypothetical protein DM02DRAFT_222359 [Periconia macrospinosa]|uniref:Uncharacterized protein n=1 Tax=Periconia macrospinosa TaxID=97972 RepID=A0A2V1D664_9PLEO|nr:hypothetical protein DM02DRAFT_222359 [Periconia macrospinosa]